MHRRRLLWGGGLGLAVVVAQAGRPAYAQDPADYRGRGLDAPYLPTPQSVVDDLLALARVDGNDVLYDLGCGDGRIVITAAQKFGTRGIGIDIDRVRIDEANENARRAGVTDRVRFKQEDIFECDFREATVVALYLLPEVNLRLRPILLQKLRPGSRVVSHDFHMGDWKPDRTLRARDSSNMYYWRIPEAMRPG